MVKNHTSDYLDHFPDYTVFSDDRFLDTCPFFDFRRVTDHRVGRNLCSGVNHRPTLGVSG